LAWGKSVATKSRPPSHQPRNHLDVSREAVQPGDNKRRTKYAVNPYRFVELLTIILPTAQRFGILGKEGLNSFALGVEIESGEFLPAC
jgi:hypothetical protein